MQTLVNRRRDRAATALAAALSAATLLVATAGEAYERQWHVGGGVSYALASGDPPLHGVGPNAHLTYGLTDAFNLALELQGTVHPSREIGIANAAAGVAYVFDVLQWVPYVGLMAGGYYVGTFASDCVAGCTDLRVGGSVPFGLDYQVSRSFAVGFAGREHLILGADGLTNLLTLGLRAEYIWGY